MAKMKKSGRTKKASVRRPSARKAAAKKSKKRAVKKAVKKAARRRVAKKAVKKAAKRRVAKKAVKKAAKKRVAKKAAKKATKARAKRAPNPAFMKAMMPDADLAAVVGAKAMPRTEVTKRVWDYVRKNNLQDAVERRMINADDNLRKVFDGKSRVSMFEMTKYVNNHLK
ncbi:MAG: SWIB/MDM2 domain-containing protein [Longimicrobiales bacterium]